MNAKNDKLSALLRTARASPELPPRFPENVWRRIEADGTPAKSSSWLDALAILVLRPKFAYATVAVLLLSGILPGVHQGDQTAHHNAQIRYLASVDPDFAH